jgi:hypothetical protein
MSYDVVFTSQADIDLQKATDWYELKKSFLGWDFREHVSRSIDNIMNDKVDYQIYSGIIRKIKLTKFPYNIYYLKDTDKRQITVLALFHFKQNPESIKEMLG